MFLEPIRTEQRLLHQAEVAVAKELHLLLISYDHWRGPMKGQFHALAAPVLRPHCYSSCIWLQSFMPLCLASRQRLAGQKPAGGYVVCIPQLLALSVQLSTTQP